MVKKKETKKEKVEDEGMGLDDAFADDEDVVYAESKPKKKKIKEEVKKDEFVGEAVELKIKFSKPISKIKKGDKIKIDGKEYEVDAHYILIEHGKTNEMAIELFGKDDKDYQLRYFDDQVERTLEFYELQEILYVKKRIAVIEW
jgi:hypothetical protein